MLTELQVKNLKPRNKKYMLRDSRGLYLRVDPSGRKYWILRYHENKKERQISLGPYPVLSLKNAREKCAEIQTKQAQGESPSLYKDNAPKKFFEVVKDWQKIIIAAKSESYQRTIMLRLNKYILPEIGQAFLKDITPREILSICRKIENAGYVETAKRVKVIIGQVFRFAIANGWAESDPTYALTGALMPQKVNHYPTFTDAKDIAFLMRAIKNYPYEIMRYALLFSVYTAARPGEIRKAEWSEIDFEKNEWRIPAAKMKMRRVHIVPLSRQVLEILKKLKLITGDKKYLFPSPRNDGRPMSENGTRVALRSIGFSKEQIVPHGFRAMFSSVANEHEWSSDVIERQLAHADKNAIRRAYNHAEYMPQRVKLMQWWADYLDSLI